MPIDDRTPFLPFGQSEPSPEAVAKPPRGYSRGKVTCICEECGKATERYQSQQSRFCSVPCRTANRNRTGVGLRPRNGAEMTCEVCGKDFYASPSELERRRFCSTPCNAIGQSSQVRMNCVVCGILFSKDRGNIGGKYCTTKCYQSTRAPRKTCKVCGGPLKLSARTYCSHPCRDAGRRKGVFKPCEICGKDMYVTPCEAVNKRFCSTPCRNEGKKIKGPGARTKRRDGYVVVYYPAHPDASTSGLIMEHRLVAEQKYGRRILSTEHVHHLNGTRDDNRPENLEVIAPGDHARISNQQGVELRQAKDAELARLVAEVAELRARLDGGSAVAP